MGARHCPGFEHAIQLETQIVVQSGRSMLLDDETAPICGDDRSLTTRLRRFGEVALCLIGRKLHPRSRDLYPPETRWKADLPHSAGSPSDHSARRIKLQDRRRVPAMEVTYRDATETVEVERAGQGPFES